MTPLEVLRKAGWTKGRLHDPETGALCLLGALLGDFQDSNWMDRAAYYVKVVNEQFPDRTLPGAGVTRFNDHPDTTWDDVVLVCEKAQLRYDEEVR